MRNRALGAVVLTLAAVWSVSGQSSGQDAQSVLADVASAMGAADIKSIRYVGSGFSFAFGQNYSTDEPWPRFRMEHYDRFVSYDQPASREEIVRTQAESPARGGGNQPIIGIQEQVFSMSQDAAWNETSTLQSLPASAGF